MFHMVLTGNQAAFAPIERMRLKSLPITYIVHYSISKCVPANVHPKMKIVSSFTQPHVIPNLYEFVSYAEHKGRYFELLVPIDFHSRERNTMEVNRDHQPFDYQHSSKYLLYCST